jgi:hypothetical protein
MNRGSAGAMSDNSTTVRKSDEISRQSAGDFRRTWSFKCLIAVASAISQAAGSWFTEEGMVNIFVDLVCVLCLVVWACCAVLATGLVLLIVGTLVQALIRASSALFANHR